MRRPFTVLAVLAVSAAAAIGSEAHAGPAAAGGPPSRAEDPAPDDQTVTTSPDADAVDVLVESTDDQRFPRQEEGAEVASSGTVTTRVQSVEEYTLAMIQFVDSQLWTPWFLDSGYAEPLTGIILLGGSDGRTSFVSKCPDGRGGHLVVDAATPNAYYCSADDIWDDTGKLHEGSLILPLVGLQKMWTGDIWDKPTTRRAGDFAAATLINHEYGHAVVDELVLQSQGSVFRPNWKWAELIADCFSGVAAYGIWSRGYLDAGDIDEAIGALVALGDYEVGASTHHGTPTERERAFRIGLYGLQSNPVGGLPANCIQEFWKYDPNFPS